MKVFDLTKQQVICGDMVSNIAMAAQQIGPGEEATIIIPEQYEESLNVYEEALKLLKIKVLEVKKGDGKLELRVKKE